MTAVDKPAAPARESLRIVADATCTRCGCLCDDIELTVRGDRIVAAERACALGQSWFLEPAAKPQPSCRMAGQEATLAEGIEQAARILCSAKYPLVYGLRDTTCEAQRAAVCIADWIGGSIDTTTSTEYGPVGAAFQGVGEVTASLGEIANRGDLILFWGSNPLESHPRHLDRYSLHPKGMFLPGGRKDRTCVFVDVRRTESSNEADLYLQIKPGSDFEALWTLRALAAGIALDADIVEKQTGVSLAAWQDLMERMKRARFGVILFGTGVMKSHGRHLNSEAVLALVRDMNAYTRFVARPMRGRGNVMGADSVLAWSTGYPFGVSLSRGYPRFNPGEFTANELLERGEADAALVVGTDSLGELSPAARDRLAAIPLITLGPLGAREMTNAAVSFTTAIFGIHSGGTVYRMDDVPLPLRPALTANHPGDYEILAELERRVMQLKARAY